MVVSGIAVELVSLTMCIVVGFVFGVCWLGTLDEGEWPTEQMSSRGGKSRVNHINMRTGGAGELSHFHRNGLVGLTLTTFFTYPSYQHSLFFS